MIGLDAQVLEALLHRDANGAAAAPQADEEIGVEIRRSNIGRELEGIPEQIIGSDEAFGHCCCSRPAVG